MYIPIYTYVYIHIYIYIHIGIDKASFTVFRTLPGGFLGKVYC
jgi:hypothetical protein